jgi:CRISPR-associated protein Csa1
MFLSHGEIDKKIRVMRKNYAEFGISEELRGYSWETPPVEPINDVRISISDLYSFCDSHRDAYVKYILKEKPKINEYMLKGLAYHRVFRDTVVEIKKAVYSGMLNGEEIIEHFWEPEIPRMICDELKVNPENCIRLYRYLILQIASRVDDVVSKSPQADAENIVSAAIPPVVERQIDGSAVGLSKNLRVDVFMPNIVFDLKSGREREEYSLNLSGYALALESSEEIDVNFGFIVYLRFSPDLKVVLRESFLSDEIRRSFIEIRDEIAQVVDSGRDPGLSSSCSKMCAFFDVCHDGL